MPSAGRTSMPATLPLMPWIFQDFTTFLAPVSTIEIVLSPDSAATCAACADAALSRSAADAARNVPTFMATLRCSVSPDCDHEPDTEDARGRMPAVGSNKCEGGCIQPAGPAVVAMTLARNGLFRKLGNAAEPMSKPAPTDGATEAQLAAAIARCAAGERSA